VVPKWLDADLEEKVNNSSFCEHEHYKKNEGSRMTICVDAQKSICPILICVTRGSRGSEMAGCRSGRKVNNSSF
jgi:hypothetical protein